MYPHNSCADSDTPWRAHDTTVESHVDDTHTHSARRKRCLHVTLRVGMCEPLTSGQLGRRTKLPEGEVMGAA